MALVSTALKARHEEYLRLSVDDTLLIIATLLNIVLSITSSNCKSGRQL